MLASLPASQCMNGHGSKRYTKRMRQHIIYIPGLGDTKATWQKRAVKTWSLWGVTPHTHQMMWADRMHYDDKFKVLLDKIDEYSKDGPVGLVCASAGAVAALQAFAARPEAVSGVVCIAGKIHRPEAIGGSYLSRHPSFVQGAHKTAGSLGTLTPAALQRVLSIRGAIDPIVPAYDSILTGAYNRVVPTIGHAMTIGSQLLFGAPFFLRFIKSKSTPSSS